ncbi:hypothetical protein HZP42_06140 [Elizabethkingia anophelis]|uniref:hypothetical protein n=1 Tax=Elizabethkingia anophelis TaxID=1117645 RepID=UPI000418343B|nr:hypothetical protein [Elizabethkingia anophelis]MCT4235961.1 hypothetical protein [Elizabethkingia anophelis]
MSTEEMNNILKLISANITENRMINEEIVKLLRLTTIPPDKLEEINRLMSANKAMIRLLTESIPT